MKRAEIEEQNQYLLNLICRLPAILRQPEE
jgi:hypothetical protein